MKKFCLLFLIILFSIHINQTKAQFGIPTEICPQENLNLSNPSSEPINYWDFCTGDLSETPSAQLVTFEIPNAARPEGAIIVTDGINWYGFICNRNTSNIIRVDFGNSLDNNPSYTDLGNIDGVFSAPLDIEIVKSAGVWYGLVSDVANENLVRINFGTNLNNDSPSAEALVLSGFYLPNWFDLKKDGNDFVAVVALNDFATNQNVALVRFENGMNDATPDITITPGANNIVGVDVIRDGNNWYGVLIGFDNKIYHLDFGTSLYTTSPTITEITGNITGTVSQPFDIELVKDGSNYVALIQSPNPVGTYKLDFGDSMSNLSPSYTDYGNVSSLFGTTTFLTVAHDHSNWRYFVINRNITTGQANSLVRVSFPNNCNASQATSDELNPSGIFYVLPETYTISLDTYDSDLNLRGSYSQDIIVKSTTVGLFEVSNVCLGETTIFNNTSIGSDANVLSWNWDFGDGNTSNVKSPSHRYTNSGEYNVTLSLINADDCNNSIQKTIKIPRLDADFEIASGACPGETTQFQNTSQTQNTGILTYRWLLNNGDELTFIENPSFTYPSEGSYDVNLIVYDGTGCNSSITKSFNFVPPPTNAFIPIQTQAGIETIFQDQTDGNGADIVAWEWTFADLSQSTSQNPVVTFQEVGEYLVTLKTTNQNGCEATFSQLITVDSTIITNVNTPHLGQEKLIIYPNPAKDIVTLECYFPKLNDSPYLTLSNVQGQVVQILQLPTQGIGKQQWQLDISQWEAGVYFLNLYWEGQNWKQKLLINR